MLVVVLVRGAGWPSRQRDARRAAALRPVPPSARQILHTAIFIRGPQRGRLGLPFRADPRLSYMILSNLHIPTHLN